MSVRATILLVVASGCGDNLRGPDPEVDAPVDLCDRTRPWAREADLLLGAGQETVAVAVDAKVYVIGGFLAGTAGNVVQVFDTEACTWSRGPDLPTDVHHTNAAVVDDTIYIVGPMQGGAPYTALGLTWAWTPSTDATWRVLAPMPAGTERGASVTGVIDGKIYVAGGLRAGLATTDVSFYDPIANTWTPAPPLPALIDHACGGGVGGKLYVIGGRNVNAGMPLASVHELTPGGAWSARTSMPTARSGSACGVFGNRIVIAGGEANLAPGSRGVFSEVEAYNAIQDSWETLTPMPTPRHGMGAAAWDGRLYIPGGADQQGAGAVAIHEVLTVE